MTNLIDLLKFLVDNPSLLLPLIALAVVWPMLKRIGLLIERAADGIIFSAPLSQVTAFCFLVHFLVVAVAAITCYGLTDYRVPGVDPEYRGAFGPKVDRLIMWSLPIFGAALLLFPFVIRAAEVGKARQKLDTISNVCLFGIAASAVVIFYSAQIDSSWMFPAPEFKSPSAAFAWWISYLPILSVSMSIASYVIFSLVKWLWALAGKIAN